MPVVMRELSSFIEDFGYEAVAYNNTAVRYNVNEGVPVREGYPNPGVFLHFRIAGVICGMGEIGWSNIFLTPEFGPRQRLAFIFSDAELEPDPIFEGGLCDKCMRCVKDCPANAISRTEKVEFSIENKKYEYAKLDEERCWIGFHCGSEETNPFLYSSPDSDIARWMLNNVYKDDSPYLEQRKIHSEWTAFDVMYKKHLPSKTGVKNFQHPGCMCGATCMRTCFIHLEEQKKLKNKFHIKFRIRKPWRLDPKAILREKYASAEESHLTDYSGK